jgi:Cu(I)/Ag(I) efflux system membrane protein CusA/SilA
MVETTVRLKPQEKWRRVQVDRWYSSFAPEPLKALFRPFWPDERAKTWDELTAEMNERMKLPGWTNAWTMPIKTRVDMLTTGVRTPIGVKVFGTDLQEIERVGTALEGVLSSIPGTRSVLYERNLGGLYLDILPKREELARYGLRVGDVQRTTEAAIGGTPITFTVEGRERFSVNVRYPEDLRSDSEALRRVLVSLPDGRGTVPLGQVADIRIVGGPPMVRDEDGLLVGYVYVDIDQKERDIGGYVNEAKAMVNGAIARGELALPSGYFLKWTGQYEELERMAARMKILIPLTLAIIVLLLYLYFKHVPSVLIVLLSIPFALVGTVWLLYLLDYHLSTAVWIGIIALAGLATQTGIVMILYINHALEARRRAGMLHTLDDVIAAHLEGTVQRVRPKLMTVGAMLAGLVPLLWASGSGADVMKRIAAPMVGGLFTSAFLTLEIIPVISTYFRREELLWEKLAPLDASRLTGLKRATVALTLGVSSLGALLVAPIYVDISTTLRLLGLAIALLLVLGGTAAYLLGRPAASRLVWP